MIKGYIDAIKPMLVTFFGIALGDVNELLQTLCLFASLTYAIIKISLLTNRKNRNEN